ncbi:hypothetical protein [Actinospica sp.]|jgi:hypothetical protein|uniref:hypothetical protein n=1 Tax=Actinospica sp. TaxID=1872142 RepID=UPI002CC7144D|nr:hypothetical protein [Actinospica sp.]HWG28590.1 hypothetical protein [Actinospica sp.]
MDADMDAARLERCVTGRLARAYPAAAHDLEVRAVPESAAMLRAWARGAFAADPGCRRVVYSVRAGDRNGAGTARDAGFRHVVDVELADAEELELWVAEPAWVTVADGYQVG